MSLLPPGTLSPGAVFHGRYRVVRAIKAGGMGAVYEAIDANTASPRALKVMLPSILEDADQRARFALEARVTGNVDSDHVVRVSDSGIDEATGSPFLVMELLRGEDLGAIVKRQGPLPPADVVTYLSQAALALDKTHAGGIVHRDIKPDNLFLSRRDDGSPCIKILDFGIAKVVARDQAQKTRALGTPLYMAPEQIKGESAIGPRSDLYALGHVAYALLAGEAYFREESAADETLYALLMKIMAGADEPPSTRALRRAHANLPPGFDAWFLKATAVNPDARFDRATAQITALSDVLAGAPFPGADSGPRSTQASVQASPGAATAAIPPSATLSAVTAATPQEPVYLGVAPTGSVSLAALPGAPAVSTTLPSPGAPVELGGTPRPPAAPLAPAVPVGPVTRPRSKGLVFALVGIGAVAAVGVLLLGASKVMAPSCVPGATCASIDLPDPAHVDAQAIIPMVEKLAKNMDGRASLAMIAVPDVAHDGTTNVTGEKGITYSFTVPGGGIHVTVRKKLAVLVKAGALPVSAATEPRCSMKTAWKAAVGSGLPTAAPGNATYANTPALGGNIWTLSSPSAPGHSWIVDGQTCALKKF